MNRIAFPAAMLAIIIAAFILRDFISTWAEAPNGSFQPPSQRERTAAIGSTRNVDRALRRALDPGDSFDPIPSPGPSDWLANHTETGQTFDQFARGATNRPDQQRHTLYLQPLGKFDHDDSPDLKQVKTFAKSFFQMDVKILPAILDLKDLPIKSRVRDSGVQQLLSTDILHWCEGRMPADAYCLLAVTMQDLYPDERWNFVFGQASLNKRVGVYSFARYVPGFYGDDGEHTPSTLRRSCKVLAHETGHMFGIKHCIHFHCVMNGSNHLGESDQQPLHLCPVCLRKLQLAVGFDVVKRYQQLQAFSLASGFAEEHVWLMRRLQTLQAR